EPVFASGSLNLTTLIAAIRGIPDPGPVPDLASLMPALPPMVPSLNVSKARNIRTACWVGGALCAGVGLSLLGTQGPGPLGGFLALGGGAVLVSWKSGAFALIEKAAQDARSSWREAEQSFAQLAGNELFQRARRDADGLINQAQGLPAEEQRKVTELSTK